MTTKQTLINSFNLTEDDFFSGDRMGVDDSYEIITKSGIRKIAEILKIKFTDIQVHQVIDGLNNPHVAVVVNATAHGVPCSPEVGEASPFNNNFPYPVSVALKRAKARLVIQQAGIDRVISEVELSSIAGLLRSDPHEREIKEKIKQAVLKNKKG